MRGASGNQEGRTRNRSGGQYGTRRETMETMRTQVCAKSQMPMHYRPIAAATTNKQANGFSCLLLFVLRLGSCQLKLGGS